MTLTNGMRPVHPGEILGEDYLVPLGMSARALANALRGITAETAMRLARYFGGDARSWLNLQAAYNLPVAEKRKARRNEREITPSAA
jgi:plasmid maintenance system antidote protein VapI